MKKHFITILISIIALCSIFLSSTIFINRLKLMEAFKEFKKIPALERSEIENVSTLMSSFVHIKVTHTYILFCSFLLIILFIIVGVKYLKKLKNVNIIEEDDFDILVEKSPKLPLMAKLNFLSFLISIIFWIFGFIFLLNAGNYKNSSMARGLNPDMYAGIMGMHLLMYHIFYSVFRTGIFSLIGTVLLTISAFALNYSTPQSIKGTESN